MRFHAGMFGSPWTHITPTVHRYLTKPQYAADFWNKGELRLSAFSEFRKHRDEVRRDTMEGAFSQEVTYKPPEDRQEKALYIFSNAYAGSNCYLMSTSVRRDLTKFGTDYFTILDTTTFAQEVARQLPGFVRGWEGLCIYGGQRSWSHKAEEDEAAAVHSALEAKQMPPFPPISLGVLFTKPLDLADELEYRLIWVVDHPVTKEHFVTAPRARQSCAEAAARPVATGT